MKVYYGFAILIWGLSFVQVWLIMLVFAAHREACRGREINGHISYGGSLALVTILLVGIVDLAVRMLHLPLTVFFRSVHVPCIVLMIFFWILWALALTFKGKRHVIWFRLATLFTLLVTLSGDILVYQLMWNHHQLALLL